MVDTLWSCLDESCPKFNIVKIKFKNISTMRMTFINLRLFTFYNKF